VESATSQHRATVERVYELFNSLPRDAGARRESPLVRELLAMHDSDVVFTQSANQPEGRQEFRGREQLREAWDQWFEAWAEHRSRPEEVVERGDRVLVLSRERLVARDGIKLEHKGAAIFTFRAGKIVRLDSYTDQDTARREFEG
jgi:ketosteroid isomerase-like protein